MLRLAMPSAFFNMRSWVSPKKAAHSYSSLTELVYVQCFDYFLNIQEPEFLEWTIVVGLLHGVCRLLAVIRVSESLDVLIRHQKSFDIKKVLGRSKMFSKKVSTPNKFLWHQQSFWCRTFFWCLEWMIVVGSLHGIFRLLAIIRVSEALQVFIVQRKSSLRTASF